MDTTKNHLRPEIAAQKLTPLEMNKLAILKDHTVITFSAPEASSQPQV